MLGSVSRINHYCRPSIPTPIPGRISIFFTKSALADSPIPIGTPAVLSMELPTV